MRRIVVSFLFAVCTSAQLWAQEVKPADSDEAGHAFQFEAGRVFRSEAGHPWRRSHGSIS